MKAAIGREFRHPLLIEDRLIRVIRTRACHRPDRGPRPLPHRHCAGVTTYQAGVKVGGETMGDRDDRLSAARQDLDLLTGDLRTARGQLEEFATMWRRQCHARNSWQDMPHAFPQGLRDAADGLAAPCERW